jgi:hypothetical protein
MEVLEFLFRDLTSTIVTLYGIGFCFAVSYAIFKLLDKL